MIKRLLTVRNARHSAPRAKRHKGLSRRSCAAKAGWTPERRARQAALIRLWQPWRRSTGPKTEAGKARCAMNFARCTLSDARLLRFRRAREVLRAATRNLKALRAFLRNPALSRNGEAIPRSGYGMQQQALKRSRP